MQSVLWLDDFALFIALKEESGDKRWSDWQPPLVRREPAALQAAKSRLAARIALERFVQFQFAQQWSALKSYAQRQGVQIIGDIPIFVAHDSVDVWANQEMFYLEPDGRPTVVAGVPPDYFCETGQLWGNPLYRWDLHAERNYDWWIQRFAHAFRQFDLVRLDHFRGFESYWEVPGDAPTAAGGRWMPGPGAALFRAAEARLGHLPLIAEDLGVITPPVETLRDELGAPGMRVLQFAFGPNSQASDYLPHKYIPHCVVYTGTHDNDTTVGWFHSQAGAGTTRTAEEIAQEQAAALAYLNSDGTHIAWDMIRLAWSSVADTAIAPLQDLLELDSSARMNQPGIATGNWMWRLSSDPLPLAVETRLKTLTEIYERTPR